MVMTVGKVNSKQNKTKLVCGRHIHLQEEEKIIDYQRGKNETTVTNVDLFDFVMSPRHYKM